MARTSRISSQSGYNHIITRGVNKQDIFLDRRDYERFLGIVKDAKAKHNVTVISYCLMSNHVHFLLYNQDVQNNDNVSSFMHDVLCLYAIYFNKKYDRSGHLFQNRYMSRIIETQKYLMLCIRYIHNNPVKAGIGGRDDYPWSSYHEYIEHARPDIASGGARLSSIPSDPSPSDDNKTKSAPICSTSILDQLFGSIDTFIHYHDQNNLPSEMALEYFENHKVPSDTQVKEVICYFLNSNDPSSIQSLPRKKRNAIIDKLLTIGIHTSQISRITGLSNAVITHRK